MKPAILLDLDGTLVDSRADLAAAANAARAAVDLEPLPIDTIAKFVGDGLAKLLERSCPGIAPRDAENARNAFLKHYSKHCCDETHVYPGVMEVVKHLHEDGHPIAVVTNKPRDFAQQILETLGISPYVGSLVGGDDKRKPDPAPLLQACEELGVSSRSATMCGDHHTDLIAGRRAGCRTVWCSWGIGEHGGEEYDEACDSPDELIQVING